MHKFPDARVLDVDLTNQNTSMKTIPGEVYRLYPGGSALGVYLLLHEMEAGVEPFSSANMLIFSVSPLTGLPISGQSRMNVTSKSPLTGGVADSQSGGFFPVHLKANGYDAIIFRGKAEKPVYFYIDGDRTEFKSAEKIWGKVTGESEKQIKREIGEQKLEIAQIGPAGENLVRYASIMNMCNRANGRNGTGAVMGSKNLKAIVLKKAKPPKPVDPEKFKLLTKDALERLKTNCVIDSLGEYGTDVDLEGFSQLGFLPTRNWTSAHFPEGENTITGTTMAETILKKRDTCYACVIRCKRVVEVTNKVDPIYGGPEFETCATFGSYCGISNLASIAYANQLCNMYGIDTISCGATIAFAMECYEKGLVTKNDTDGLEIRFGNEEIIPILIEKIAKREGFGDLLAEGSFRAAKKIGGQALEFSISVKGQELAAHMPQFKPALGLIYAVNPFGADHQSSDHDTSLIMPPDSQERIWLNQLGLHKSYNDSFVLDDEKVRFAVNTQQFVSLMDTLCLCQFAWGPSYQLYGPSDLIDFCKHGIGWDTSLYELMLIGERRINMMRFFNQREGFSKKDDTLPKRMFQPLPDGPSKGTCLNRETFEQARETYYEFMGWDKESGNPAEATLRRLSLGWLLNK